MYDDFTLYEDGIYHHDFGLDRLQSGQLDPFELTNHDVLITGYGTQDGVKYWNVKNSWGTEWGRNGFFRSVDGTGGGLPREQAAQYPFYVFTEIYWN